MLMPTALQDIRANDLARRRARKERPISHVLVNHFQVVRNGRITLETLSHADAILKALDDGGIIKEVRCK